MGGKVFHQNLALQALLNPVNIGTQDLQRLRANWQRQQIGRMHRPLKTAACKRCMGTHAVDTFDQKRALFQVPSGNSTRRAQ